MASSDAEAHNSRGPMDEGDDPMQGSGQEEEGEGDVVMPDVTDDDSSEEGEDDEEEARRIREGFIVDEDEDEEEFEEVAWRRFKERHVFVVSPIQQRILM